MRRGLIVAAPASGAGKTVLTLGLLRALRKRNVVVSSAKSGPDYIDPRFHAVASGKPCLNLDAWAMSAARLRTLAAAGGDDLMIVEGAMGLFDGAPPDGRGSVGDLAAVLGLPVALVVDAARLSQSVAPLVQGFVRWRDDVRVAGVILNRIGSARHEAMLRRTLASAGVPVLGALPRSDALHLPSRHLGLVQAGEHPAPEAFVEKAACIVAAHVDLAALEAVAAPIGVAPIAAAGEPELAPLGQRIAVASDVAFAFTYVHMLDGWRRAGAELSFFSPLADEPPAAAADAVFLPGGYPELHAQALAAASTFGHGLREAAARGALIYGECGGYMVLGEGLVDVRGHRHEMTGLLPLVTSFAEPLRALGYRRLLAAADLPWPGALNGHEFHYATMIGRAAPTTLFTALDAEDEPLGRIGMRVGRVMGSFAHVVDRG